MVLLALGVYVAAELTFSPILSAQEDTSSSVELGIIVVPTLDKAEEAFKKLKAGTDFCVLAKEVSVDPSAAGGGYLGRLSPVQLLPELRDALIGVKAGQITKPTRTANGFAILTIFTVAPDLSELDTQQIFTLVTSGAVRQSFDFSGFEEADTVFLQFPKPEGWNRDLRQVCEVRKQSQAQAIINLQNTLSAPANQDPVHNQSADTLRSHYLLAQLYAYNGKMAEAIEQEKLAYAIAQTLAPVDAKFLRKAIGASYLHLSEMENGVYHSRGDLGIFPPLPSGTRFEKQDDSRQAIQYLGQALSEDPDDYQLRWLLNVAYATLGEYPDKVPPGQLIPASVFKSPEDIGRFKDVSAAIGVDALLQAGGVVVDDFENNGLLDIVASSQGECDPLHYYHNNGDGTFTDRTVQAGLADQLGGLNVIEADYNNDGCMDLLVLRGGWEFPVRKSLLRNNCDGTFTDVTEASGLGATVTATQAAAWADIDNDGFLDLFIANEASPSQLFRNRGDGTFEDISHSAGIDKSRFSKGVTAADYDNDGYVDFYVSNLDGANLLYHNNHDRTFTEIGREARVQATGISFATWFFDYDNDGWPDLFVTSYPSYTVDEVMRSYMHLPYRVGTMKLYRNLHNGTFQDVTAKVNLDKVFMPMGANFGDVDNDGFLDIYLGSGTPSYGVLLPQILLKNDAGKTFSDITSSSGTGDLHKGHGIAFADLFRTGHEDIVGNFGGAVPGDRHTLRVFQNPGNDNDWINVRLVGVKSNRAAVGAKITVTVENDGGGSRTIVRTVGYGSSFGGNPMEQHIGLGHGARIIGLDIWWPASDTHQHFSSVDKNRFISIKEFATEYEKLDRKPMQLPGANPVAATK
jgi:tetratricopeptide (TPR) repeat protein